MKVNSETAGGFPELNRNKLPTSGFSLIELLISISIIAMLVYGVISGYERYSVRQKLQQTSQNFINDLRFAENQALSGVKPSGCTILTGYQVSFTQNTYTTRAKCSPEGLVGTISSVSLPTGLTFDPVPSSIIFGVLTGGISSSVSIYLKYASFTYQVNVDVSSIVTDKGFQ